MLQLLSIISNNFRLLSYKQRIIISYLNKEISKNLNPDSIVRDHSNFIKERIDILENEFTINNINRDYLLKTVYPSKTAQNGLNFLTQELEKYLISCCDIPEILKIFKLIHLLLKENMNEDKINISKNLFENLFPKYNVPNLSILII